MHMSALDPSLFLASRHGVSLPLGRSNVLLEEDGAETRVERADALVLEDLTEATDQTVGEAGGRDETNTGGLEGAESDGGEELGAGGGDGVDGGAVLAGLLDAEQVDRLLLEELVPAELEGALDEVAGEGRAETGKKRARALVLDHLAETANHATVIGRGVELNPGLDAAGIGGLARVSDEEEKQRGEAKGKERTR